jgi:hypothetical protein
MSRPAIWRVSELVKSVEEESSWSVELARAGALLLLVAAVPRWMVVLWRLTVPVKADMGESPMPLDPKVPLAVVT